MVSWFGRCHGVLSAGLLAAAAVCAQGNPAAVPGATPAVEACRRDVQKYQAHIEFVRKTLGDQEADALAARFLTKAEWDAVLLGEGHCGLARRLRARKLVQ